VFNARYAAFFFSDHYVVLDVLPVWSKNVSRFFNKRTQGKKPAEDLKHLILESGERWHQLISERNSRSYATLFLLSKNHRGEIAPESIKPDESLKPRLSRKERESLRLLQIKAEELFAQGSQSKIKTAYKKLAKIYHPDMGGDAEKFRRLNDAHLQMLLWAANPQFTLKKALSDCWSFDGATNKWSPPL